MLKHQSNQKLWIQIPDTMKLLLTLLKDCMGGEDEDEVKLSILIRSTSLLSDLLHFHPLHLRISFMKGDGPKVVKEALDIFISKLKHHSGGSKHNTTGVSFIVGALCDLVFNACGEVKEIQGKIDPVDAHISIYKGEFLLT